MQPFFTEFLPLQDGGNGRCFAGQVCSLNASGVCSSARITQKLLHLFSQN